MVLAPTQTGLFLFLIVFLRSGQMDAFKPGTIMKAANDAIAWTQSVIDDVDKFAPGSLMSANPRGWIQGTFLVGMKDWAKASRNETDWQYLKVMIRASWFVAGVQLTTCSLCILQWTVMFNWCTTT
jgi:hypothetical protein